MKARKRERYDGVVHEDVPREGSENDDSGDGLQVKRVHRTNGEEESHAERVHEGEPVSSLPARVLQVDVPARAVVDLARFELHGVGEGDGAGSLQHHQRIHSARKKLAVVLHVVDTGRSSVHTHDTIAVIRVLVVEDRKGDLEVRQRESKGRGCRERRSCCPRR